MNFVLSHMHLASVAILSTRVSRNYRSIKFLDRRPRFGALMDLNEIWVDDGAPLRRVGSLYNRSGQSAPLISALSPPPPAVEASETQGSIFACTQSLRLVFGSTINKALIYLLKDKLTSTHRRYAPTTFTLLKESFGIRAVP
jgi:hypothetical protein